MTDLIKPTLFPTLRSRLFDDPLSGDSFFGNSGGSLLGNWKNLYSDLFYVKSPQVTYGDGLISVATPGVKKEDLTVEVMDGCLTVNGKWDDHNLFRKDFRLPTGARAEEVSAKYADGVLTLSLPKKEERPAITIPIE